MRLVQGLDTRLTGSVQQKEGRCRGRRGLVIPHWFGDWKVRGSNLGLARLFVGHFEISEKKKNTNLEGTEPRRVTQPNPNFSISL